MLEAPPATIAYNISMGTTSNNNPRMAQAAAIARADEQRTEKGPTCVPEGHEQMRQTGGAKLIA
jgi:hypothetical protein